MSKESDSARLADAPARLLEATIRTIQDKGRGGATAREISRAAEANLGSIVYYFGSKDELVDQALVAAGERWTDSLRENGLGSASGDSIGERIVGSLGSYLGSLTRNRRLALSFLEALASADRSPTVRSAMADRYEGLRETVAEGTANGTNPLGLSEEATDAAAGALVALFDGLLIQWLLAPDRGLNPLELVTSLGSLLGTALAGADQGRTAASSLAAGARELAGEATERGDGRPQQPTRDDRRDDLAPRGAIYLLQPAEEGRGQAGSRYVVLLQAGKLGLRTAVVAPTSYSAALDRSAARDQARRRTRAGARRAIANGRRRTARGAGRTAVVPRSAGRGRGNRRHPRPQLEG